MNDWIEDHGRTVTAAFVGVTTPLRDLYDEIHRRGWTVAKVDIKDGNFMAQGKNPHGETVEAIGPNEQTAVAHVLMKLMRKEWGRAAPAARHAAWGATFDDQLQEIAEAYADAKFYDPKAAAGFKDLGDDSVRRSEYLAQQLDIEVTHDPAPYKSLGEMIDDVTKKKHLFVSDHASHHPLWSVEQVVAFRAVHDVFGHVAAGGDWGWHGANLAFAAHAPLLHPEAQKALFTETLGQTAFNMVYRALGPQKIVFLDDQLDKVQKEQNSESHSGVHPSQMIVPGKVPDINEKLKKKTSDDLELADPNNGWRSHVDPLPDNGFLWHKHPAADGRYVDPLDYQGLRDYSEAIDTGWHAMRNPDGGSDTDSMRQAIANAFRAVLTQPRKTRRGNAQHYQALMHIPFSVHDPLRYWDALEKARDTHNQARNLPAQFHVLHINEIYPFKQYVRSLHPDLSPRDVDKLARKELFNMQAEEEERAAKNDPDGLLRSDDIEREALKNLSRRLKVITKGNADQKYDYEPERLYFEAAFEHDIAPYPAPLASHVKSIAAVSHNIDELTRAARKDMRHGGRGHHFRASALKLGIPGVGPAEASYAWMLLAPHTSQLGVLQPEILDALGYKPHQLTPRDYFKYERELAAGRDASGYNHVPLGQFGWGLYDHFTYGPGAHQDHGHLRVLNPTPHTEVSWQDYEPTPQSSAPSNWWDDTQQARDEVAKNWDRTVGIQTPAHQIPFTRTANIEIRRSPVFIHPQTGEPIEGEPGQSLMSLIRQTLGLDPHDVWANDLVTNKR